MFTWQAEWIVGVSHTHWAHCMTKSVKNINKRWRPRVEAKYSRETDKVQKIEEWISTWRCVQRLHLCRFWAEWLLPQMPEEFSGLSFFPVPWWESRCNTFYNWWRNYCGCGFMVIHWINLMKLKYKESRPTWPRNLVWSKTKGVSFFSTSSMPNNMCSTNRERENIRFHPALRIKNTNN